MKNPTPPVLAMALGCLLMATPAPADFARKAAPQLVPKTTFMYVELSRPNDLIHLLFDSQLRQRAEGREAWNMFANLEGLKKFQMIIQALEVQSGLEWRPTLETVSAGGVSLALDAGTDGVALLLKSKKESTLVTALETFLKAAREDAENKGNPDPFPVSQYRGFDVHKAGGGGGFAQVGPWLILVNKGPLGQAILDRFLEDDLPSLASHRYYKEARAGVAVKGHTLWSFVDVDLVREAQTAPHLFDGRLDNPLGEILFGGIAEALKETPMLTSTLDIKPSGSLELSLSVPFDAADVPELRQHYFGKTGMGRAPAPLQPPGTLLTFSAHRDLAAMWADADALFDEEVAAGLSRRDADWGALFQGGKFGADVLSQARSQIQFLLARQDFESHDGPAPSVRLPGAGLVFRVKDPGQMKASLTSAFQGVIGFINIFGSQFGLPRMELEQSRHAKAEIHSGIYQAPDETSSEESLWPNFSPSIAHVGDYFIITTARPLARQLAVEANKPAGTLEVNSQLRIDAVTLSHILRDNQRQIIEDNQRKKSISEERARNDFLGMIAVLNLFRDAEVLLNHPDTHLSIDVKLNAKP